MAAPTNILATSLAGIDLRNPVVLAAGTSGVLDELRDVMDLSRVGALTTKSITPEPREGNATWRVLPLRAGMLNAIGLANPGLDVFLETYAPRARAMPCKVFASVAGFSIDDYVRAAANIDAFAADSVVGGASSGTGAFAAIELNVSCPNVQTGLEFGASVAALTDLLKAVRPVVKSCRLFVKLAPNLAEIVSVANAAVACGGDALTVSNTLPGMAIDVEKRTPALANVTGGLSGPAIHPHVLRLVHEVYRKIAKPANVPIIAAGGVMTWTDAAEFILAGATAVQMGTALMADPRAPYHVVKGLEKWAARQGVSSVGELIGALKLP